jgi:hypothetical protein
MGHPGHKTVPGVYLGDITEHRGLEGSFQGAMKEGAYAYAGSHSGSFLKKGRNSFNLPPFSQQAFYFQRKNSTFGDRNRAR